MPCGAMFVPPQIPAVQPTAHALPQLPQWFGSVPRFASQPFATSVSQFAYPAVQVIAHVPFAQLADPPDQLQACPHAPQCDTLVARLTSQPSPTLPLQSAQPVLHAMEQLPAAHVGVPCELEHGLLQPPQCNTSVAGVVSHPGADVQSANPGAHAIEQAP